LLQGKAEEGILSTQNTTMDFFDSLSETVQIGLVFVILAVLFVIVFLNNRRNKEKRYNRRGRNFKDNYYQRKREKEK
jgi:hypothetical protein|tara:strand:+ start:260 stop:490 length:231 start_codon:yes stop_codon:yes gene_type:complete